MDTAKVEKVRRRAGFDHMLVHESDGRSGGLLMMWTSDISIREQGITKNFINVIMDNGVPKWRFTWDALCSIHGDGCIPWLVMEFCSTGRGGGRKTENPTTATSVPRCAVGL